MIQILIALFALLFFYWYIWRPRNYWKNLNVPYQAPWPIIGNFAKSTFQLKPLLEEVQDVYESAGNDKVCGVFIFGKPALIVKDVNILKQITIKDFDHFMDHSGLLFNKSADPFLGRTLFMLAGQKWRTMRATLSPVFTSKKMKEMFDIISECGSYMAEYFIKEARSNKNGQIPVEMKNVFSRFTNDVISTTMFGIKCDSFENQNNEFYTYGKKMTNFSLWRMFFASVFPWMSRNLKIGYFPNNVYTFFQNIIKSTLTIRKEKSIYRPDLLNLLMQAQTGTLKTEEDVNDKYTYANNQEATNGKPIEKAALSDDDIAAQAMLFFLGGFDTTSGLLSFIAYELALNPDVQKKLQNEIDAKFEKSKGRLTYQDIQESQYLDMVMSETLRKWPPGAFLDRLCVKTCVVKNENGSEITIPEGTNIILPAIGYHRDPQYFPNPGKFDPERFSEENKHNVHPIAYMPFGLGPRICIGNRFALLEMKIALMHLLAHFDLIVTKETQIPLKLTCKSPNMAAENGIHLALKLRK